MTADPGEGGERFDVTNGRITGVLGLALVGVFLVSAILDPTAAWVYPACLLAAVAIWMALLRPAARVERGDLVVRNMISSWRLPLAAIDQVAVRQVLAVQVGGRRYVGLGVSRSRRQSARDDRVRGDDPADRSYGAWVEERIWELAEADRQERGITRHSQEQDDLAGDVRRLWAWPELALVAVLVVVVVGVAVV